MELEAEIGGAEDGASHRLRIAEQVERGDERSVTVRDEKQGAILRRLADAAQEQLEVEEILFEAVHVGALASALPVPADVEEMDGVAGSGQRARNLDVPAEVLGVSVQQGDVRDRFVTRPYDLGEEAHPVARAEEPFLGGKIGHRSPMLRPAASARRRQAGPFAPPSRGKP